MDGFDGVISLWMFNFFLDGGMKERMETMGKKTVLGTRERDIHEE